MPSLRRLEAQNFIPRPTFGASLITATLDLSTHARATYTLDTIHSFLEPLSSLRNLSISLANVKFTNLLEKHAVVEIPSLRSFSLSTDVFSDELEPLTRMLRFPNVIKLCSSRAFDEESEPDGDCDSWMTAFVADKDYRSVTQLELSVKGDDDDNVAVPRLEIIFDNLPQLRHLSIKASDILPPGITPTSLDNITSLRTLRLEGCSVFDEGFVLNLATELAKRKGATWEELDYLELVGLESLDKERLGNIIPEEKISWEQWKIIAISRQE